MPTATRFLGRAKIITGLAREAKIPAILVSDLFEALNRLASKELAAGRTFRIPNLGWIEPRERKAHFGRDPRNGRMVRVPTKTMLKAYVSTALKEGVAHALKSQAPALPTLAAVPVEAEASEAVEV